MDQYSEEVLTYGKGGKYETKIFKFLMGKAMAASKGTAEPETLQHILKEVLDEQTSGSA